MPQYLRLSFRLFDRTFHGRGDGGAPEWPPSPLRGFQALVAAAGQRWRKAQIFNTYARDPLTWLEGLGSPEIVAPTASPSIPFRLYVPNNHADIVAAAWSGGDSLASIAEHRVEKDVRSTRLTDGDTVHYLWPIASNSAEFIRVLNEIARQVTHLGWGVDMVAGNASEMTEEDVAKLSGERWKPQPDGSGTSLRVPCAGTLDKLMEKHTAFLNRLSGDGFKPVPPLTAFAVEGYRRETDPVVRPFAAFEIHKPVAELAELPFGKSRFRSFDTVRRFAHVAGMVRNAAKRVAESAGWEGLIKTFVLGHGDGKDGQANTDDRLMFLPLPSITPLKVESIRRVLVVGPPGWDIARLRQLLNGCELIAEGDTNPVAMLSVISQSDPNVMPYTGSSRVWSTVTPVALPGFDDPHGTRRRLREKDPAKAMTAEEKKNQLEVLERRIRGLLDKAFEHAGLQQGLLKDTTIEWRSAGFRAGVDLASRYVLDPLKYPRYHVRVRFPHSIRGPLAVGAGRYRGLGLFAAESD